MPACQRTHLFGAPSRSPTWWEPIAWNAPVLPVISAVLAHAKGAHILSCLGAVLGGGTLALSSEGVSDCPSFGCSDEVGVQWTERARVKPRGPSPSASHGSAEHMKERHFLRLPPIPWRLLQHFSCFFSFWPFKVAVTGVPFLSSLFRVS